MRANSIPLTKRHILALLEVIRLVRDFQIDKSLDWEAREALDELLWRLETEEQAIGQPPA